MLKKGVHTLVKASQEERTPRTGSVREQHRDEMLKFLGDSYRASAIKILAEEVH